MNAADCGRMIDAARELWPEWDPADREVRLWAEKLKWAPDFGVVEWALGEHRTRSKWRAPALADVRSLVNAEYARRKSAISAPSRTDESGQWAADVARDRAMAAEWANGLTDEEMCQRAESVTVFAGRGKFIDFGLSRKVGESPAEHAVRLRRPGTAMIVSAGLAAMADRRETT